MSTAARSHVRIMHSNTDDDLSYQCVLCNYDVARGESLAELKASVSRFPSQPCFGRFGSWDCKFFNYLPMLHFTVRTRFSEIAICVVALRDHVANS